MPEKVFMRRQSDLEAIPEGEFRNLNDREHCEFRESIRHMDKAIFGDPENESDLGMEIMVKEMHEFFIQGKNFGSIFIWLLKGMGIMAAAVLSIIALWKFLIGR